MNTSIKEVTKGIEEFHFNIAVASVRSLFNSMSSYKVKNDDDKTVIFYVTKTFLILINPMVPHLAEELWHSMDNPGMILNESWPKVDLNYIHKNYKGSISFVKDIRATITTQLNETYRSFIKQKIRWINFAKAEKNIYSFYVSLVVFLMNTFLILHFILLLKSILYNNQDILYSLDIYIFLFIFFSKFIVDYIFISSALKFFRLESLSIYIFPFQIIFAFYVLLIVPLSYIIKPEWKNNSLF